MLNEKLTYYLPSIIWRWGKQNLAVIRYHWKRFLCRRAFRLYADQYPQTVFFVAGLPKSGTTWLESLICSYSGIKTILIPEVTTYELEKGQSHDYALPDDFFCRFRNLLALTKMHISGTEHNASILRKEAVRYVVIYRDLRDVAVSYQFYVKRTPWHPEFSDYRRLNTEEALRYFAENTLVDYERWIRFWHRNRDTQKSIIVTYEELLADTFSQFTRIAQYLELDSSHDTILKIVEKNSFANLSGGRQQGQESNNSFFRSGTSGGWKKHFTPKLKDLYKEKIGDFLIEFGYENDLSW